MGMDAIIIILLIALVAIFVFVLMSGAQWERENAGKPGIISPQYASAPAPKKPTPKASLYDRLGGEAAIDAAVDVFYRRVLADAYIKRFFEGVDMARQAAKQKAFLTMVFGGPNSYTGLDMRTGHRHLVKMGLDDTHFDHVLAHLRSTLAELGVGEDGVQEVIGLAETTRDDVLDR
jgi:hemoglobin